MLQVLEPVHELLAKGGCPRREWDDEPLNLDVIPEDCWCVRGDV